MEDGLKKNENGRRPQFFFEKLKWRPKKNGRQPKKKWKMIFKKNGRRPKKNISKNGRRHQAQFKKSTLIVCDIIVN